MKDELHWCIDVINDEEALSKIYLFLWDYLLLTLNFPRSSKKRLHESIEQGKKDFEEGRFISREEAKKKYSKWIREK